MPSYPSALDDNRNLWVSVPYSNNYQDIQINPLMPWKSLLGGFLLTLLSIVKIKEVWIFRPLLVHFSTARHKWVKMICLLPGKSVHFHITDQFLLLQRRLHFQAYKARLKIENSSWGAFFGHLIEVSKGYFMLIDTD